MSHDAKLLHDRALAYHESPVPGKIKVVITKPAETADDLTLAYSPGVAEPVREIAKDPDLAYRYTGKGNSVAIISNGTAILGLIVFASPAASVAVIVYFPPTGKNATSHFTFLLSSLTSVSPAI